MAFRDATDVFDKKHVWITIDGEPKTGKSHLALTLAVGHTSVIDMNEGLDGVVQKRVKALAEIHGSAKARQMIKIAPHPPIEGTDIAAVRTAARKSWDLMSTDFKTGLGKSRTTILDSGTDLYRMARQAELGGEKSTSNKGALDYEMVNSRMRGLTRLFHAHKSHLVMTHQLEEEWVQYKDSESNKYKSRKSGRLVRDAWKNIGFDVEIGIRTGKKTTPEGLIFTATIEINRFDPTAEGTEIEETSGLLNLPYIIGFCTGTDPGEWEK